MKETSEATSTNPRQSAGRAVVAATIGNMLEWYDFTIFAIFAVPISKAFFPSDNEVVSLLLTLVTFGLGFIARPFGAIVLGDLADRRGRRDALSVTIMLMALGTGIIAICPGYDRIGIAAPIIILVARLIQGFSAGGEIGGAVSTLAEYAPPERRGFYASFQQMSQGGTTMLSGLVATLIAVSLSATAVVEWGWRIAFIIGLLIAPVGLYIRRNLEDAPLFKEAEHQKSISIRAVLRDHWRVVLTGMLVVMLWTVAQYIANYIPTFSARELKMPLAQSYLGPLVIGIVLLFCPLVGVVSDRFGRKRVMMVGALGLLLVAYPAFSYLVSAPSAGRLISTQIAVAFFMLIYTAPASAVLAELFPTSVRATGISLTYSLGVALFGGFTPAIITALISWTTQPISIAFYLMGASVISLAAVMTLRDRTGEVLK